MSAFSDAALGHWPEELARLRQPARRRSELSALFAHALVQELRSRPRGVSRGHPDESSSHACFGDRVAHAVGMADGAGERLKGW